ncbi:transporter substrate-binding domain-containing protein [bacterium]|nr:transporter substrate-binding domain-containing protein [bacterium]
MKKYILFTFLIFLLAGCSVKKAPLSDLDVIKQRGYIIVGVKEDSPPFGYYKDNQFKGLDIEIARAIAKTIFNSDLPDKIRFVAVNPQNRIAKLNAKEIDLIVATLSVNDKRKLVVNFSEPYYVANQKLMVSKNSKITNLSYFNTHGRLGVVLGTLGETTIHLVAPNAQVVGAKNYDDLIYSIKNGDVEGVLGDDCILKGYDIKDFKIINRSYSTQHYAVGARKSDESKELLENVNYAIATLKDEKKLDILNEYFESNKNDKKAAN